MFAWGINDEGQLGVGDYETRHYPDMVRFCLLSASSVSGYKLVSSIGLVCGGIASSSFFVAVLLSYLLFTFRAVPFSFSNGLIDNQSGSRLLASTR